MNSLPMNLRTCCLLGEHFEPASYYERPKTTKRRGLWLSPTSPGPEADLDDETDVHRSLPYGMRDLAVLAIFVP